MILNCRGGTTYNIGGYWGTLGKILNFTQCRLCQIASVCPPKTAALCTTAARRFDGLESEKCNTARFSFESNESEAALRSQPGAVALAALVLAVVCLS
jgi:hypothetical protein